MKTWKSFRNNKWLLLLSASLVLMGMACRLFSGTDLPATEIPISTEAAGSLETVVQEAIQNAQQTGIFQLSLTEEQVTSYVAIKLQETEGYYITDLQIFLRDGKVQGFASIEQMNIELPLEFEVAPEIVPDALPRLLVTSVKVSGITAPDVLKQTIQNVIDQAYSNMINDAAVSFVTESITISDGVMTISGHVK